MAINIVIEWSIIKAITKVTSKVITNFLFNIYYNYKAFCVLLFNNRANLTFKIVNNYLK